MLRVPQQGAVHVAAGVLEQLVGAADHDEGDLTVAQDAQLIRLLHHAKPALGEGHLVTRADTGRQTGLAARPSQALKRACK